MYNQFAIFPINLTKFIYETLRLKRPFLCVCFQLILCKHKKLSYLFDARKFHFLQIALIRKLDKNEYTIRKMEYLLEIIVAFPFLAFAKSISSSRRFIAANWSYLFAVRIDLTPGLIMCSTVWSLICRCFIGSLKYPKGRESLWKKKQN